MASKIQLPRGNLYTKDPRTLVEGELFWVPSNIQDSGNVEDDIRKSSSFPYDGGTLYIGRPSLNEDRTVYESPMAIAGERSYKSMVYRGTVPTTVTSLGEAGRGDGQFKFVREGDFFVFEDDAVDGVFKTQEFLKGDILLITHADYNIEPDLENDLGESYNITYIKINAEATRQARTIKYENTEMEASTVEEALDELQRTKVQYKGRIPDDWSLSELMTSADDGTGNSALLKAGYMYLVTSDGIKFSGTNVASEGTTPMTWVSDKGDFVVWQSDELGWMVIPSGYTNANEIDFDPEQAAAQQDEAGTFTEDKSEHINSTRRLTNVQEALTYLLSHKAMLDSNGKVPLSQLHSTVLGNMQYMGVWNPVSDPLGVTNPIYQNNWPVGRSNEDIDGDEETAYDNTGNKAGDYYIVKTDQINVQYYDRTSAPTVDGKYKRVLELNNGDWIVYQAEEDGTGHWEKIDNSDRISMLNFTISGEHSSGEADYLNETYNKELVGTPTFAASDKLVIWDQDNVMTVAGVRLVDQYEDDAHRGDEDTYLPVYKGNTDTLMRSSIQNYTTTGGFVTQTNSNLYLGSDTVSYNEYVYGSIFIRPHLTLKDNVNSKENSGIQFEVYQTTESNINNKSWLYADPEQVDGSSIFLPDESSKIIGKLSGVTLIEGRLTKSTSDGYIDSTSIEEHMRPSSNTADNGTQKYSDLDVVSVEFHAPVLDVNNIETRHITLGQKNFLNPDASNGGAFENGTFLSNENLADIFAHFDQNLTRTEHYLPQTSGVLLNENDWKNNIQGTEGTLPIYGQPDQRSGEGEPRNTLIDSKVKQISNVLFGLLYNSASDIGKENVTHTMSNYNNVTNGMWEGSTDSDYAKAVHGEDDGYGNTVGTKDNIVLGTDTIIGEVENTENGYVVKDPRSLFVTKSLLIGNDKTNTVHIIPGREMFSDSSQYRFASNEATKPVRDVYLELPADSGVILTDQSRIDGGLYLR